MTHKQTVTAIRMALLLAPTRSERHGVYPRRRPRTRPVPPRAPQPTNRETTP